MKSKLLKILTGVVAASAVSAPVTAFASPVKATEAENTNTETTDTTGDVKTTDKALEDTKKEAQQDTTKSDTTSDETKNDTTNKDSNTLDEKTTKDSTSDNQTDNQNADSKKDISDNKGNASNASKLSKQKQGYINILNSYIQIDLNNLSQYSLSELQDRAQSNDLASISEDFIKDPNYASLYKQAVKVKKALNDYLNGLYNSSECVAFQNKLKTIDTSTPEGVQEALKAFSQLSPRLQEYVCDLPGMQDVFGKDSEIKVLFDDLKGESTPDWNDFFKKYNQLSAEKKAIVKNYDPDKIKSGARSLIDKAIDDANTSKQSDDLKNFLADFDEAAGHITSQNRAQIAKEYLNLSKADQNYVKTHLDGAVEYFGLDDAVAQAQKSGQKESSTTQKSSTLRKKVTAIFKKFKGKTTSSKVDDATDAVSEILEMIEGIF